MTLDAQALVVRLAIGLVFALAAATKVRRFAAFADGVSRYFIGPRRLAVAAAAAIVAVEAFIAITHVSGWAPFVSALVTSGTVLVFAAVVLIRLRLGADVPCLCFDTDERASGKTVARLACIGAAESFVVWSTASGHATRLTSLGWQDGAFAMSGAACLVLITAWLLRSAEVMGVFTTPAEHTS